MLYNDVYAGPQSHITSRSGTVSFSLSLLTTFRFRHSSLPGCNLVCYNLASLCSPLSDALASWYAPSLVQPSLPSLSVLSFQVYTRLHSSYLYFFFSIHSFPSPIGLSPLLQSHLSLFWRLQCSLLPLVSPSSGTPSAVVAFLLSGILAPDRSLSFAAVFVVCLKAPVSFVIPD